MFAIDINILTYFSFLKLCMIREYLNIPIPPGSRLAVVDPDNRLAVVDSDHHHHPGVYAGDHNTSSPGKTPTITENVFTKPGRVWITGVQGLYIFQSITMGTIVVMLIKLI